MGQLLVAHALQGLPSGASNLAFLEEARVQYARIVAFFTSLEEKNAGAALESLRLMFQDNLSMMATLQDASRMALEHAQQQQAHKQQQQQQAQQPQVQQPAQQVQQQVQQIQQEQVQQQQLAVAQQASKQQQHKSELKLEPVAMSDDNSDATSESDTGRASIHEEEAAQALTGLRALTPRVNAEQEKKLQSVNAAQLFVSQLTPPPVVPQQQQHQQLPSQTSSSSMGSSISSSTRNAAYPSAMGFQRSSFGVSARSPLSITAPQIPPPSLPGMGSPIFHQPQDLFAANKLHNNNNNNGGCATPSGTLPSIFSRPLLAPLGSPIHNQEPGNMFASHMLPTPTSRGRMTNGHIAGISTADWKSVAPSTDSSSSATLGPKPEPSPTSVTPVTTAGFYRTFTHGPGPQTSSPVKRKSITSKQLMATPHTGPLGLPPSTAYAVIERSHPVRKANPRRWTKDEDEALRQAVESHREKNWKAIAAEVPGRNHTQCLQRWTKVLAPGLVKGHWSPQEDDLLRRLVASEQKNWGEVAAKIPGRTSKQCRERWHNHLDPNIVRGAYSPEEDRIILEAQARLGNRWSVIAAMLPGRTEDAVKIRWKSHCRVWRARKYLRKSPSDQPGGGGGDGDEDEDDEDEDEDDSDTESLSGMETPLTMTPMTPGYGHAFVWPTAPSASPRTSLSSSNSSNGKTKNKNGSSNGPADESSSSTVGSEKRSVRVQ